MSNLLEFILTKVVVVHQAYVPHLLPHGDLLYSTLVQRELLCYIYIAGGKRNRELPNVNEILLNTRYPVLHRMMFGDRKDFELSVYAT